MAYQSFKGEEIGASDSLGKLTKLQLPSLKGKSFLDLGCNAGFFCGEALRQGAKRVVGIDNSSKFISEARQRFPDAEFLNQSWDFLPQEKFDVVIMLSAMHYESNPRDLLRRIHDHLSDDGLFVFETGTSREPVKRWIDVPRGVGTVLFPSYDLIVSDLLSDFSVRNVGGSVKQSGDPLNREVFHCRKWRPACIVFSGKPNSGKTNLQMRINNAGMDAINADALLYRAKTFHIEVSDSIFAQYIKKMNTSQIDLWVNGINSQELSDSVANYLFFSLPKEASVIFVEGYVFENPLILESFTRKAKDNNWKLWISKLA